MKYLKINISMMTS